jgi:hypothetical protein
MMCATLGDALLATAAGASPLLRALHLATTALTICLATFCRLQRAGMFALDAGRRAPLVATGTTRLRF